MTMHDADERRLHELLHAAAPDLAALDPTELKSRPSGRHRTAAVCAAVLAVLALVGGVLAISSRSDRHRGALDARGSDQLAAEAPCDLVTDAAHQAGRGAVARFAAVAVVNCRSETRTYAADGEWRVLVRQVATAGLPELIAALTAPDEQSSGPTACTAIGYLPLTVLLADGHGGYLHPRAPTTTCGAPQPAVVTAIGSLGWRTVSVTKTRQLESQGAVDSGCPQQWKNEAALDLGARPDPGRHPVLAEAKDAALHVCIYRVGNGSDETAFDSALTLTAGQGSRLRVALAGAGPSGDCPVQRSFAVINDGTGTFLNVELGGCWRVVRNDLRPVTIGSADPAVLKQVLGLP